MGLEKRNTAVFHGFFRGGEERAHEVIECVLRAVVGVHTHLDGVVLGDLMHKLRERDSTVRAVLDGVAREVVGTSGRDLNDAVRTGFGEALEDCVDGL